MSTIHDTTKLKPYQRGNVSQLDNSLPTFIANELGQIQASLNATITALRAIEARIVAGGL